MNKLLLVTVISTPLLLLSACSVQTAASSGGYNRNYVYSAGYYNDRPYRDNNYYIGYDMEPYGTWGNYDYYGGF